MNSAILGAHWYVKLSATLFILAIVAVLSPDVLSQEKSPQPPVSESTRPKGADVAGKAMFEARCKVCHSDGQSGGCLGPILAGEAARRTRSFILDRITDSDASRTRFAHEYRSTELMPHLRVHPDEAKKLAAYVLSLPAAGELVARGHTQSQNQTDKVAASPNGERNPGSSQSGKKLLWEKGCLACHSVGGSGGTYAPPFDKIGAHRSEAWINEKISTAQLFVREGDQLDEYSGRALTMPPVEITRGEIADIASFLATLK